MSIFSRRPNGELPDDDDPDLIADDDNERSRRLPGFLTTRRLAWSGLAILIVVVGLGVWLAVGAFSAKSSLEQARTSAQQAKDALLQGNADDATRFAEAAQSHAQAARDATHSLPWHIAAAIPWLGGPFNTGQQISDVVLGLAGDVLKPSAEVGSVLAPDQLLAGGRLDVVALKDEEPKLSTLSADATRLNDKAKAIPEPGYISVLGEARTQLQEQTHDIAQLLGNTAIAAKLAPSLMGADGPRSYFMGFQTNAEARGTGGLLGGFGILRFDNGEPTVDTLGPNIDLDGPFAPLDLGPEFAENFGFTNPTTDYRNSNQSSHFPYAAQIWKSMWEQQAGQSVNGVIALDPVALSYMLGAVGSITMPDGERITKDNVVELTESTAYVRFPDDQIARKEYLQNIATEVVKKITGELESPRKLLEALGKSVSERRIMIWSSSPADQELLERTPLAHTIPDDSAPYAEVVINNLGGNKLDYYLTRDIEYVADGCNADTRESTVTIRLTNTLQNAELPDYVSGALGFLPDVPLNIPKGTMLTSVRLLATQDAQLVSALSNGQKVQVFKSIERNHPSFEIQVAIPPGKSGELSFRLSEPTSSGGARVPVQPLVDEVKPVIAVPECAE